MAEEMQGIMSLSEGQQEPMGQIDPTQFSPVVESYARSNPREFNNDILGGMAQADPALVDEFIRSLASLNLPAEVLDAIQTMVDGILSDPEDYVQNRAEFIKEGVPEELLPLEFDPAFFAALNVAVDQLEMSVDQEPEIPRFADGGIINVREIAGEIAKMGRNGDTMLAHITPAEARILRRRGGSGTINPETGLPEFFLKKAFKAVGKVFKGVGKAVTSAVKSVGKVVKKIASSPIGKIALTAAAVYFMGSFGVAGKLGFQNAALANGVNTFAGSTLVNVASGQKIGDAIRGGLVSGTLAGGATALFDGGVFGGKSAATTEPAVPTATDLAAQDVMTPSSVSAQGDFGSQMFPMTSQATAPYSQMFPMTTQAPGVNYLPPSNLQTDPSFFDQAKEALGSTKKTISSAYDKISPRSIQQAGLENAKIEANKAYMETLANTKSNLYPEGDAVLARQAAAAAQKAAMPGVLSTYGPMAATALAGATALGAFKQPELEMPQNIGEFQTTGQDLLRSSPEEYGLTYGGTQTTYAPNPYENLANPGQVQFSRQDDPYANLYSGFQLPPALRFPFDNSMQGGIGGLEPRRLAKGGTAEFPRKTGPINGPGTGTSDSVPAMLSDGEFVFTAKAVRALGNGSRRKGAKRMYAMMKQLERKAS